MSSYIIKGGNKLEGTVKISGSKNSSLPIIAATILNGGETTLYNVPNIHDTQMMFEILRKIGGKVTKKKNKVIIDTKDINKKTRPTRAGLNIFLPIPPYTILDKIMAIKQPTSTIHSGIVAGRLKAKSKPVTTADKSQVEVSV